MTFAPFVLAVLTVTPASVHGLRFTAQSFEASRSAHHDEPPEIALVSSRSAEPLQRELLKELRTLSVAVPVLDHMRSAPGEVLRGIRSDQVFEDSVTRLRYVSDIRRPESGVWAERVLEILFSDAYLAPERTWHPPEPAGRRPIRFATRSNPFPRSLHRHLDTTERAAHVSHWRARTRADRWMPEAASAPGARSERPLPGPLAASREGVSRRGWERLDSHQHEVIREP